MTTTAGMLSHGFGAINPDPRHPRRAAARLLEDERDRLISAPMYYVTDEMTAVAQQAGAKLPTWSVWPHDIPSPSGFMVFGASIGGYKSEHPSTGYADISIVAASWGRTSLMGHPDQYLWVTYWSAVNREDGIALAMDSMGLNRQDAQRFVAENEADLAWDNEVLVEYGSPLTRVRTRSNEILEIDPAEDASPLDGTCASYTQTVRAAWLLMKREAKKPIATTEERWMRKSMQRQAENSGQPIYGEPRVTVVRLHTSRRSPSAATTGQARGKVKFRSLVSGHVRWQPYKSRNIIEPIWIEPYVRGPDNAPFRAGPKKVKVNLLDRPPGGRPPVRGK
ncbi:hypothetical protein [Amycolatopsis sp. GM8]|uniref:hypothetical protein n=1 Tax=Amycolatopsis sp. GM8 TaxID=2896530 RepID=UPI001F3685FD|nr:hypothetical protein [Amycolatopsis sp. GM8]